jgi:DKNYY family protein
MLLACSRNSPPNSLFDSAGYHVKDGKVYYLNAFPGKAFEMTDADADAASFKVLNSTYGRDKSTVFVNGYQLTDADTGSFELLDRPNFAKDRRHVYQRQRQTDRRCRPVDIPSAARRLRP